MGHPAPSHKRGRTWNRPPDAARRGIGVVAPDGKGVSIGARPGKPYEGLALPAEWRAAAEVDGGGAQRATALHFTQIGQGTAVEHRNSLVVVGRCLSLSCKWLGGAGGEWQTHQAQKA